MKRAVYKYPLDIIPTGTVALPKGAQVLHIDRDPARPAGTGALAVWALVDADAPPTEHTRFRVYGTGHGVTDDVTATAWRATVIDGHFVWHVFRA